MHLQILTQDQINRLHDASLEILCTVGHDGNFLAETHTLRHFRKELWFPQLLDREFWSNWADEGATTMRERCIEMKNDLLRDHVPTPPDEDTIRELDKIVDAARRHLG